MYSLKTQRLRTTVMSPKPESANEDNPELPTKNKQTPSIGSLGNIISYLLPNSSSVCEPREVDGWDDVVGRLKSDNGSAKLQHQTGVVDETLEDLGATLDSSQPHTATVQGPIENPPGNAGESGVAVDFAGQIEESGREKTCNEKEELKRRLGRVTRKNEKLKKEVTDADAKIEESKRIHEQRLDEERKKSAKLEKTLEDVNALLTSVEVSFAQHKTDASLRIDKLTEENKELLQKTEKLKQDLSNTNRMVEDLKRRRKQDQERLKQEKQSAAKLGDASRFSIVSPTSSVPPTPLRGSHGAEQGNDVICKLLTDANDALRNENLSLLARVDELTRDRLGAVSSAATGELEKAEREVVKLRQDLLAADAMIKEERRHRISVRQTLEEEKGKVASLKDQLDKASSAMGPLDPSSDAGILKTALQRTETLLKTRTAELRLAESYLPKCDTVTSEIIITAVQEINMKILDIAVSVSEAVAFPSGPKCVPSLSDRKIGRLKEFVGEKLFSHLRDKDHSVDPTFVQLAVQTTLAGIVRKAFLFWPFRTNSDLAYGIETVFQHMLIHGIPLFSYFRKLYALMRVSRSSNGCVTMAFISHNVLPLQIP